MADFQVKNKEKNSPALMEPDQFSTSGMLIPVFH